MQRRALLSGGLLGALAAPTQSAQALTPDEKRSIALFLEASPSVLGVTAQPAKRDDEAPPISGSAFVWDQNHVVTNFHVIDDLAHPFLTFKQTTESGKQRHVTLASTVVGADPMSDVAVLQITGVPQGVSPQGLLRPLRRATSSNLRPGQEVYALGNPFGLESSMSRGVISGLQRSMPSSGGRPITGIIQTDTSVNPGNSGGPLLNSDGAVIGINAAILSRSGNFAGVSLAIPIDTVERNVESMLTKGYVSRASLGVMFAPDDMTKELNIEGAMVMRTYPGGPASKAGMRPMRTGHLGDVVIAIDGTRVGNSDDVFKLLDTKNPGDSITIELQRASMNEDSDELETLQVPVSLGGGSPPAPPRVILVAN